MIRRILLSFDPKKSIRVENPDNSVSKLGKNGHFQSGTPGVAVSEQFQTRFFQASFWLWFDTQIGMVQFRQQHCKIESMLSKRPVLGNFFSSQPTFDRDLLNQVWKFFEKKASENVFFTKKCGTSHCDEFQAHYSKKFPHHEDWMVSLGEKGQNLLRRGVVGQSAAYGWYHWRRVEETAALHSYTLPSTVELRKRVIEILRRFGLGRGVIQKEDKSYLQWWAESPPASLYKLPRSGSPYDGGAVEGRDRADAGWQRARPLPRCADHLGWDTRRSLLYNEIHGPILTHKNQTKFWQFLIYTSAWAFKSRKKQKNSRKKLKTRTPSTILNYKDRNKKQKKKEIFHLSYNAWAQFFKTRNIPASKTPDKI